MTTYTLGVLGGSGLYRMEGLSGVTELVFVTQFGKASDVLVKGSMPNGTAIVFLPRHGRGHHIAPHQINYRANICALKKAGVTHLVSVSAVGSMREEIAPGHLVCPDQFIDLTKRRVSTFFDDGVVGHVMFADPTCKLLRAALEDAADTTGGKLHRGGVYTCVEGPQFSTRAESMLYRTWGISVIGMTAMPEAKLAREAELPYANLSLATDYDCWHAHHDAVTIDQVIATMNANIALARKALMALSGMLPDPTKSVAHGAAKSAVRTAPSHIGDEARARLSWLMAFA
jgi:5'-methylthioadenosine phosphorylase